jgi:hypothetical protein
LSLFPFFFLILWLGAHPFGPISKRLIQVAAGSLALGLLGLHVLAYREFNDYLVDYLAVEPHLEDGHTLLPAPFSPVLPNQEGRITFKVGVFRHAAGYLAAQRGVVELENYEATAGYFPVKFRPEVDPFVKLGRELAPDRGLQAEPPSVNIDAYETQTGKRVDYVLLWNLRPEKRDSAAGKDIFDQLGRGYELTYTSPQRLLQLYRRKTEP